MTSPLVISNQTQITNILSKIGKQIVCQPFLVNDSSIIDYLSSFSDNIAHTTNDNHIICRLDGTYYKFIKPSEDIFLNTIDATDAAIQTQQNINAISNFQALKSVLGFSKEQIETLNINIIDKPTIVSKHSIFFMITYKNAKQYLDFVSCDSNGESCNFSNRGNYGLIHSGDKHYNSYFMQSIKLNQSTENCEFILCGIGYNNTPLMSADYKYQKPSMCCYSPDTNSIGIIPFKQTQSILGNTNTTLASAVITQEREYLYITPYTTVPENNKKYNTTNKITCNLPTRCIEEASKIRQTCIDEANESSDTETIGNTESSNAGSAEEISEDYDIVESDSPTIIQFTSDPSLLLDFGEGSSKSFDYLGNENGTSNKYNPALFGPTDPESFNGSITPSNNEVIGFKNMIDNSNVLVLHIKDSNTFPEECGTLIKQKVSCLMIINVEFNEKSVIDTLESIKLSCSKYANHCSIVLAKCSKTATYYWIRGIRWNHETVYQFGDIFNDIELCNKCPYPTFTELLYNNKSPLENANSSEYISKMSFNELVENQDTIIELFIQMSVLVHSNSFRLFKRNAMDLLKQKQEENEKEVRLKIKETQKSILETFLKEGIKSEDQQKKLASLKHIKKQNRSCVILNKLTHTILSITSEGTASSKAASKSLENSIREDKVKENIYLISNMTIEDIHEFLETIEQFVIAEINPHYMNEMLTEVSNNIFNKPKYQIASLHTKCAELDGFTVGALAQHIRDMDINHELKEGPMTIVCGESETNTSVPIPLLDIFSKLEDPRHFKWIERVNDIDIAKFRLILRRMIPESVNGRKLNIKASSQSLTYFLISMFISVSQSIKIKFSSIPTDNTSFTVIAMRNLLGTIFTMLASGSVPLSNMWKVLSHYPTHIPVIEPFDSDELWILQNLIDMFPYCKWESALPNFKKNTLTGITKLFAKYIITSELNKIGEEEKKQLAIKTTEIAKDLTTVWQWQKLVIISILKIKVKDNYDTDIVKHVGKYLLDNYPDINEDTISFNHKKSNSSNKLKIILKYMLVHGKVELNEKQLDTIRFIIAKRMHPYYYNLSKEERNYKFSNLSIKELCNEMRTLTKLENDKKGGPSNKYLNSWSFNYSSPTKDSVISQQDTFYKVKEIFTLECDKEMLDNRLEGGSKKIELEESSHICVKYPDIREEMWLSFNEPSKMIDFTKTHSLLEMVKIMEFVFPDQNVYSIMIDIAGILLDDYKDRTKAYSIILSKYKFS